ncbi:hypothetical protein [Corynebacterium variabile]|uniref:hypothetical protein n=1 Tax=Corynebacterium variabile TaxID=1727 RepID=UPI0028AE6222|nr:hypothetical protein [Corynebacterium variabile]
MTDIPGTPGALDRVLAEQAHQYAAMLVANYSMGALDALEVLLTGLAERPDLVPSVTLRLLNLTDPTRSQEVGGDD